MIPVKYTYTRHECTASQFRGTNITHIYGQSKPQFETCTCQVNLSGATGQPGLAVRTIPWVAWLCRRAPAFLMAFGAEVCRPTTKKSCKPWRAAESTFELHELSAVRAAAVRTLRSARSAYQLVLRACGGRCMMATVSVRRGASQR